MSWRELSEQMCLSDNKREPWLLLLDLYPPHCSAQFRTFIEEECRPMLCRRRSDRTVPNLDSSTMSPFELQVRDLSRRQLALCATHVEDGCVLGVCEEDGPAGIAGQLSWQCCQETNRRRCSEEGSEEASGSVSKFADLCLGGVWFLHAGAERLRLCFPSLRVASPHALGCVLFVLP